MEPKLGETRIFIEEKCHCCGADAKIATGGKLLGYSVEKIWNGRLWVPMESYEGGWFARRFAGNPVEPIPLDTVTQITPDVASS